MDEFKIRMEDVGPMVELALWHDNKGLFGAQWHVDYVDIVNTSMGHHTKFDCKQWLARERTSVM